MIPRRLGVNTLERDATRLSGMSAIGVPNPLITKDIRPESPDTYDIGTSLFLYRKIWASEIEAIIFAQNVVTIIGGWLLIGHGEGSVNEDVNTTETQIDFGTNNLAANDFVLFRNDGNVEYMQATSQVSGNVWNVTRDLDGSGANAWALGTPYVNLGYTGDGRIELNANDTPRISMVRQLTTYNGITELVRIGDLDDNWGYTSETWGVAIGGYYAALANIVSDPTNGIRIRKYDTTKIHLQADGDIFIGEDISSPSTTFLSIFTNAQTYNSESMAAGDVLIGDNSASHANILWDTSEGRLKFRGGTTTQAYIGTGGDIVFGGGVGSMGSSGIKLAVTTSASDTRSYQFDESGTTVSRIDAYRGTAPSTNWIQMAARSVASTSSYVRAYADAPSGQESRATLSAMINAGGTATSFLEIFCTSASQYAYFNQGVQIQKGLYVGAASAADDNDVWCDGEISTDGGTTKYDLQGYTSGAPTADGYLTMVVNGTTYRVLVDQQ